MLMPVPRYTGATKLELVSTTPMTRALDWPNGQIQVDYNRLVESLPAVVRIIVGHDCAVYYARLVPTQPAEERLPIATSRRLRVTADSECSGFEAPVILVLVPG